MTFALFTYQSVTSLLDPALPLLLKKRVSDGKEDPERLQERRGYASRKRPDGPLVWMHGASIGESQVLLLLFEALKASHPEIQGVITTQTRTSSELVARKNLPGLIHQMAPIDTPFSVERFLKHWSPDLAVFAEGDIWPNMVSKLDRHKIPRMLVNARMTEKSFDGWLRFPALAKKVFGGFQTILAANQRTTDGLRQFAGRKVKLTGNMKYAAAPLSTDPAALTSLQQILNGRPVFAALSTHPGDEAMALEAFNKLKADCPDLVLILAPRHPERAAEILDLLRDQTVYQRSLGGAPMPEDNIWLCDTLGELGLWISLSTIVFLGGGKPGAGIHGHNPIEPLKLGRHVISEPDVSNFQKEFDDMVAAEAATLVNDSDELAHAIRPFLNGSGTPIRDNPTLLTYLSGEEPLLKARDAALAALRLRPAS